MKKYITTTLPYVNADPHIGYALEVIRRMFGRALKDYRTTRCFLILARMSMV